MRFQQALDDAEAALEAEENKVLRAQIEISQIRSEIEKRVTEKEEEFENTRKNHQRALESMQVSFCFTSNPIIEKLKACLSGLSVCLSVLPHVQPLRNSTNFFQISIISSST